MAALLAKLKPVTELTAIVTVGCYAIGFVAAGNTFTRAGVPLSSIGNTTFVAGGMLFLFLVATGVLLGLVAAPFVAALDGPLKLPPDRVFEHFVEAIVHSFTRWEGLLRWNSATVLALVTLFSALFFLQLSGFQVTLCSALAVCVTTWSRAHRASLSPKLRVGLVLTQSFLVVAAIWSFISAYGAIPTWYGGGRPEIISRVSTHNQERAENEAAPWQKSLCQTTLSRSARSRCRTVYRVLESEKFCYVAVHDSPAKCDEIVLESLLGTAPARQLQATFRSCFGRLATESMTAITFAPHHEALPAEWLEDYVRQPMNDGLSEAWTSFRERSKRELRSAWEHVFAGDTSDAVRDAGMDGGD